MIFIPRTLQEDVKAQNELNDTVNQVQKDLQPLLLSFIGKKIVNTKPYRRKTKQFEEAIKSFLNQQSKNRTHIFIDCQYTSFIAIRFKINYSIPDTEGVRYREDWLTIGDLENGVILKNVNEPVVRPTNISYEDVLNDFKELQRLEEEMTKIRDRVGGFI